MSILSLIVLPSFLDIYKWPLSRNGRQLYSQVLHITVGISI